MFTNRRRSFQVAILFAALITSTSHGQTPEAIVKTPKTDQYGDPLPLGAIQRYGSMRYRYRSSANAVAVSPNGAHVAASIKDGVRIWDSSTGRIVRTLDRPKDGYATSLSFLEDSKRLALGGANPEIWDFEAGKRVRFDFKQDGFLNSAYSPNGKLLASADSTGKVHLFDLTTGKKVQEFVGHENQVAKDSTTAPTVSVQRIVFSPDSKTLATAAVEDKRVMIWDATTGRLRCPIAVSGSPRALRFSSDGRKLAFGDGKQVEVIDPESGVKLHQLSRGFAESFDVAFSSDGSKLAIASSAFAAFNDKSKSQATVRIWDLATDKLVAVDGQERWTSALAFFPDSKLIASVGSGNLLHIIDVASGQKRDATIDHVEGVLNIIVSPDQSTMASSGRERFVKLWDLRTGKEIAILPQKSAMPQMLGFMADGTSFLTTIFRSSDGVLHVWDIRSGKETKTTTGDQSRLMSDGKTALSSKGKLFDLLTGKATGEIQGIDPIKISQFSPDGKKAAIKDNGFAIIVDVATGKEICRTDAHGLVPDGNPQNLPWGHVIVCLDFSNDGNRIVTGGSDFCAMIFDATTGKQLRKLHGHGSIVERVIFSRDGRMVASCSGNTFFGTFDPTVRLWEVTTGQERRRFLGHEAWIEGGLAFARNGKSIVAGDAHGTILEWDTVRPLDERIKAGNPESWWKLLAGDDAIAAYEAICAWTEKGDVTLLAKVLQPTPPLDQAKIDRLVADLDDGSFVKRNKAERELDALAEVAKVKLREIMERCESPEIRRRLESIVAKVEDSIPSATVLQAIRAIEVLERIRSIEARVILQRLAEGAPNAPITVEATQSLGRLSKSR